MKLFDSKQQAIINFSPNKRVILIYVCGITPYDSAHLGHIFTFMIYDLIERVLELDGYEVKMVRNITDIDDPIYEKARDINMDYRELTKQQIALFNNVMEKMNFIKPFKEPRASHYIQEMFESIGKLLHDGHAYRLNNDIYFDINTIENYGRNFNIPTKILYKLSKRRGGDNLKEKRNQLDFLLFKGVDNKNDIRWKHKILGYGRPGWHIECSVMASQILGNPFDLHGGGNDLMFPHHESEIAQTKALTNKSLSNYWVHVAPLLLYGEKMSKSLGNLVFAEDLLKVYSGAVIKLALLDYSYQEGGEWIDDKLKSAKTLWNKLQSLYINKNYDTNYMAELKDKIYNLLRNNLCTRDIIYELTLFTTKKNSSIASNNDDYNKILDILGLRGFIKLG